MADIPNTYPLVDANVLDVALWNRKIFSIVGSEGILSEPNGGLEAANLAANFSVRDEHVWPGEAVRAASEWAVGTLDFYNDAFADEVSSSFISIPGAASRFQIPWPASVVIYQWSLFASVWRFTIDDAGNGAAAAYNIGPSIDIGASIDGGQIINHTIRRMPETAWGPKTSIGNMYVRHTEQLCAQHYDLFHVVSAVAAGFHEVDARVRMFIASSDGSLPTQRILRYRPEGSGATFDIPADFFTRITVGVRAAGAVAFTRSMKLRAAALCSS